MHENKTVTMATSGKVWRMPQSALLHHLVEDVRELE